MLVDSSVWIDYYRGASTAETRVLRSALTSGALLAILDVILVEVLQGFRSDHDFDMAAGQMTRLPRLPLTPADLLAAAQLARRLRSKGANLRSVVDVLIAQAAISNHRDLLTSDADFRAIARHSALRLTAPSAP